MYWGNIFGYKYSLEMYIQPTLSENLKDRKNHLSESKTIKENGAWRRRAPCSSDSVSLSINVIYRIMIPLSITIVLIDSKVNND
jgi:hypothetical protein